VIVLSECPDQVEICGESFLRRARLRGATKRYEIFLVDLSFPPQALWKAALTEMFGLSRHFAFKVVLGSR
jgi:hypothetical protein